MIFIVLATILAWSALCLALGAMIFFIYQARKILDQFQKLAAALSPYVAEVESPVNAAIRDELSFVQKMIDRGYTVLGKSRTRGGAENTDKTRVEIGDQWDEAAVPRD